MPIAEIDYLLAFFSSCLTFHEIADPLLTTCIVWANGTADIWAPADSLATFLLVVAHILKTRYGE